MTIEEILKACEFGQMPRVYDSRFPLKVGTIVSIRQGAHMYADGVAVKFDGEIYEKWFHAEDRNDLRRRYVSELRFSGSPRPSK